MEAKRIDGLKYHVENLTRDELETIHGHLLLKHARLVGDIAFVETVLYPNTDPTLFDDSILNGYAELGELPNGE